jgi:hypothetical protein
MNFTALLMTVTALLAQNVYQVTGTVVDERGQPVAGAEVVLTWGAQRDGSVPIIGKTSSDATGRFQSDLPGASRRTFAVEGAIWAHKPGLGLGVLELIRADHPDRPHRLVLEPSETRKLTVRDAAGRPIAGAGVAPRLVETGTTGYLGATVPDAWLARLTTTSDAQGIAALPGLTRLTDLRSVWVAIDGHGTHFVTLPYESGKNDVILSLGRPAFLVCEVKNSSGRPVPGARVEVWVRVGVKIDDQQASYHIPERVPLDGGSIRTDSLGKFQTPTVLLAGSTYRVVVRSDGCSPAVSDWMTMHDGSNSLSPIVVQPLRTIVGRVIDRQGNPIASAQIFEPAGGPSTTTDQAGRFRLEGARSGRPFLLARCAGFRFQGRLIDSGATEPIELILSREHEQPDRMMATLPEVIPLAESRALARRLIGPYQKEATTKGDDAAKFRVLDIERWLNPAALLEQVQKTRFDLGSSADFLRGEAARALVGEDSEEAAAIAETIADPGRRAGTLIDLVDALPDKDTARKIALLERAALQARSANLSSNKLFQMGEVAERWLELGESARATALFAEGRKLAEALPPLKRSDAGSFAAHLARVEPAAALALVKDLTPLRQRQRVLGNIAIRLAFDHPAEAEQVLNSLEDPIWRIWGAPRICRRLARSDLSRAQRIAAGLPSPAERAHAWTFVADGLAATDRTGALAALAKALHEIDGLIGEDPYHRFDANPAVSILPLVERIAPDRLAEVFWLAVALHAPGDDPRNDFGWDMPLISETMLLSRYDREVATMLFEPVEAYVRSRSLRDGHDIIVGVLHAMTCLDPRNAVVVVESLRPAATLKISEPANYARYSVAEILAMPTKRRWMRIWRFNAGCGIAMFEDVYRGL